MLLYSSAESMGTGKRASFDVDAKFCKVIHEVLVLGNDQSDQCSAISKGSRVKLPLGVDCEILSIKPDKYRDQNSPLLVCMQTFR